MLRSGGLTVREKILRRILFLALSLMAPTYVRVYAPGGIYPLAAAFLDALSHGSKMWLVVLEVAGQGLVYYLIVRMVSKSIARADLRMRIFILGISLVVLLIISTFPIYIAGGYGRYGGYSGWVNAFQVRWWDFASPSQLVG